MIGKRHLTTVGKTLLLLGILALVFTPAVCLADAGDLDLTFGTGGKVTTNFMGPNEDYGREAVAVQADGKIVVVGESRSLGDFDFAVARHNNDGTLDNSFGTDGTVTSDFASRDDRGQSVAIQSDGKIVVAGYTETVLDKDFALARYNSDGSLDIGFGIDGKVTTDIASGNDYAEAVAIQADGKIVVAGSANSGPYTHRKFAIVRYNSDGTLDTGFGGDGKVITVFGPGGDVAHSLVIQADAKIVVAGNCFSDNVTWHDLALARYNADGTLDNSFGDDGKVTTDFGSSHDAGNGMAIQTDGRIVVVGRSYGHYPNNVYDFILARYNSDGSLDNSFGGDGKVVTDFGSSYFEICYDVAIRSDGKIVAVGSVHGATYGDFAVSCYNTDGTLDTGFDGDGKVLTDFNSYGDYGYAVAPLADGKIVVAGSTGHYGPEDGFALARYNSDGTLDSGFGEDGKVITGFLGPNHDMGRDVVAVQADGKILMVGTTSSTIGYDFALVRYNPDGSPDTGFGDNGKTTTNFGVHSAQASAVAIQADGKIIVVGYKAGPPTYTYEFAVARFNSDGTSDTGFGVGGKVTTGFPSGDDYARAVAIQADGKIVVAGYTHNRYSYRDDFALVRYNGDGTLDTGFGGDGKVITDFPSNSNYAHAVAIQTDGKIVVAGYRYSGSSTRYDFALARHNDDGTLDTRFGDDGKVTTDFGSYNERGYDVDVRADGRIVVAGYSYSGTTSSDFALACYNDDGTLDIGFGSDGKITTDFATGYEVANAVTIQADGKILAVGPTVSDGATGYDFGIARYNRDGALDVNFGAGGLVTTDFACGYDVAHAVDIQADGKIVVAGQTQYSGSLTGADFALARYEGVGTSPPELLALLVVEIQELVTIGNLNNGQGNALLVKLQAAIQQLDRDNTGAAVNQLQAFINQVDAFINAGVLTTEQGQSLIDAAQEAIEGLAKPGGELASEEATPLRYQLFQNYPNPFNAQTIIEYALAEAADVTVDVYDLLGRRIALLIDEHKEAGSHSVSWDAATVASGAYFYRIQAGENVETRKMVLLK